MACDSALSVRDVRVDDAGLVSDHRLVVAEVLASARYNPPVPLKSRPVHRMDLAAFEGAVRSSTLFTDPANTVDGYANQLEREVTAVLDRLAPMRSGRRRPAKPITRWLSDKALAAKRRRRKLIEKLKFHLRRPLGDGLPESWPGDSQDD